MARRVIRYVRIRPPRRGPAAAPLQMITIPVTWEIEARAAGWLLGAHLFSARSFDTVARRATSTPMRNLGKILEQELRAAVRYAYETSDTLIRAVHSSYALSTKTLTVGFKVAGKADPVTGRALVDYIDSIQTYRSGEQTEQTKKPVLVWKGADGKLRFSKYVYSRIAPWAAEAGKANPVQFAKGLAMRFTDKGMIRRPVLTRVFDYQRLLKAREPRLNAAVRPGVYKKIAPQLKLSSEKLRELIVRVRVK